MLRLGLSLIMLSGCTMIDMHTPPPSDWPKLEMVYVKSRAEVYDCGTAVACANVNFDTMKCTIYIAADDPESAALGREHEEAHCAGRDHIGSTAFRDYWEAWKAR